MYHSNIKKTLTAPLQCRLEHAKLDGWTSIATEWNALKKKNQYLWINLWRSRCNRGGISKDVTDDKRLFTPDSAMTEIMGSSFPASAASARWQTRARRVHISLSVCVFGRTCKTHISLNSSPDKKIIISTTRIHWNSITQTTLFHTWAAGVSPQISISPLGWVLSSFKKGEKFALVIHCQHSHWPFPNRIP